MSTIPPVGRPEPARRSENKTTDPIQAILDRHYDPIPYGLPVGCNLAILQRGKTPLEKPLLITAGNIEPDGAQHWGSVSKQFTGASILKLVSEGRLSLEDDIRDPKFGLALPPFTHNGHPEKITVENLLRMQSGLPEIVSLTALAGGEDVSTTLEEKVALLSRYPFLDAQPGILEQYCNTNYYLLALIVTQVDPKKRSFPDYVREEIFQRHGMDSRSSLDPSCPASIPGYDFKLQPTLLDYKACGAGGIVGKPSDMAQWNISIDRKEHEDLLAPGRHLASSAQSIYSCGLTVEKQEDYTVVRHAGAINGFVTHFVRFEHPDPSQTFAFFIASNFEDIARNETAVSELISALTGKEHVQFPEPPPPPPPLSVDKEILRPYEGIYENPALGLQYQVSIRDDEEAQTVWLCLLNPHKDLVPFRPTRSGIDDPVVLHGPIGDVLELTETGLILHGAKVAPFVLKRI